MKLHPFLLVLAAATANAEQRSYLIGLSDPPLVEHARAVAAATPTLSPKAAVRRAMQSADSQGYAQMLIAHRETVLGVASHEIGRTIVPRHAFQTASNGFSAILDDSEAARIATLPGVTAVRPSRTEYVLTDAGPQWIGATNLWNGSVPGIAATKGEGVVVGIIDTGINPTHPSFATAGGDGYTNVNRRGHFYGLCTSGEATCNAKLIGIYDMTDEGSNGVDTVGHGTHVAGIAAGNAMNNSLQGITTSVTRAVAGVAPHANIIMYKACTLKDGRGTCDEADLVAAIDQAVADGVDVINYSIGGAPADPYGLLDLTQTDVYAFFQARSAGVVVVAAAGNDGPGPNSISEPASAPWVIAAAAASHNRVFVNSLTDLTGAPGAPGELGGQGFTAGYGPAAIVYAGNFGNALCGTGDTEGTSPTGKSNPFPPGTFHGEIVVCDRGVYARVEKGYNVKAAGAGGYILANTHADGETVVSDDHYLPAVHLGFAEGDALKSWLLSSGTHNGRISGINVSLADANGDILASFSSRGPVGFRGGVLKPDITAPGANILSSDGSSAGLALMSGTSMATPNVSGSAALLIAAHPDWDPSRIESALLGTALPSIRLPDGVTPATPLDAGGGRVQPAVAAKAGLYLPLNANDLRAGATDPTKLNRVGIESERCIGSCTFTRTVSDLSGGGSWQTSATVSTAKGTLSVTPAQFTLAAGGSQTITITANVSDPTLIGSWLHGRILLHKSSGTAASDMAMPVSVFASGGAQQPFVDVTASTPGGSQTVQLGGLAALPQARFVGSPLFPAAVNAFDLDVDQSPGDPYSKLPGPGKAFMLVPFSTIPIGDGAHQAIAFIVEVSGASQVVLYAGVDYNGDGLPSAAEQTCNASGSDTLRCVVNLLDAPSGNAWFLIDRPANGNTGTLHVQTTSAVVTGVANLNRNYLATSQQTLTATGPGHTTQGQPFPVRLSWSDQPPSQQQMTPGRYFGAVRIIPTADGGNAGIIPVGVTRVAGNDDAVFPLPSFAHRVIESGETLSHQFIDITGTGTLQIDSGIDSGTGSVAYYAVRTDFPASSSSPVVAAAPAASGAAANWSITPSSPSTVNIPVTSGRWYIVATASGGAVVTRMQTTFSATADVAPTAPGSYFNPQRSGHGIFVSQAAGQQVAYWYTYLEDGTPAWYYAQAAAPTSSSSWSAPLLRVTWDGSAPADYVDVGDVTLSPVGANDLMFTWNLFGQRGSERFIALSLNSCAPLGGQQVGLNGQWYAPAQSGYGMDVVANAEQQFDAVYLYDVLGEPRWLVGSDSPFAETMSIVMNQVSGFCPTCVYVPTTMQSVGRLDVSYASTTSGMFSANVELVAPLSGAFEFNQVMRRLTGSDQCGP